MPQDGFGKHCIANPIVYDEKLTGGSNKEDMSSATGWPESTRGIMATMAVGGCEVSIGHAFLSMTTNTHYTLKMTNLAERYALGYCQFAMGAHQDVEFKVSEASPMN